MRRAAGIIGMAMLFIGAAAGDLESLTAPAVLCLTGSLMMLFSSLGMEEEYEEDEVEDISDNPPDNVVDFFRNRNE